MSENERKFYVLLIVFFFLLTWAKSAWGVCLEYSGFDPVLKEIVKYDIKRMSKNIVDLYECPIASNGGLLIDYSPYPNNFVGNTTKTTAYNTGNEEIIVWQVLINKRFIETYYPEVNKIYAFKNATYHEIFCHALTNGATHTTWGLCKPVLSTDKLYWGKKHRARLEALLFTDFKTGRILNQ